MRPGRIKVGSKPVEGTFGAVTELAQLLVSSHDSDRLPPASLPLRNGQPIPRQLHSAKPTPIEPFFAPGEPDFANGSNDEAVSGQFLRQFLPGEEPLPDAVGGRDAPGRKATDSSNPARACRCLDSEGGFERGDDDEGMTIVGGTLRQHIPDVPPVRGVRAGGDVEAGDECTSRGSR